MVYWFRILKTSECKIVAICHRHQRPVIVNSLCVIILWFRCFQRKIEHIFQWRSECVWHKNEFIQYFSSHRKRNIIFSIEFTKMIHNFNLNDSIYYFRWNLCHTWWLFSGENKNYFDEIQFTRIGMTHCTILVNVSAFSVKTNFLLYQ